MIQNFTNFTLVNQLIYIVSLVPAIFTLRYTTGFLKERGFDNIEVVFYNILAWLHVPVAVYCLTGFTLISIVYLNGRVFAFTVTLTIGLTISWLIGFVLMDLGFSRKFALRYSPLCINPFMLIWFIITAPVMFLLKIPYYILFK